MLFLKKYSFFWKVLLFPVRFKGFVIEKKCGTDQNICFMLASFEILVFPLYTRYPRRERLFFFYTEEIKKEQLCNVRLFRMESKNCYSMLQ